MGDTLHFTIVKQSLKTYVLWILDSPRNCGKYNQLKHVALNKSVDMMKLTE